MLEDMDSSSRALSIPYVLIRILKHLPARDIINVRRVCKLWNEYCECEPKFVSRKFDLRPQEIDTLICKMRCQRLNLEFQDCDLRYISDEMWKIWGRKLHSLFIYHCDAEIKTLQSIISNCIRLEVLDIVFNSEHYARSNLLERLLNYFIKRKEQHTRLQTLLINGQFFGKISQFLKIPTVFPCIVYFRCNVERGGENGSDSMSCKDSYGTYDMRKLKSYSMISRNDDLWLERRVTPMVDYKLFRLTTLKTVFQFRTSSVSIRRRERLLNFITIQKDLEIVDLSIYNVSGDDFEGFIKSLIFHVLKTCSNLREFRLQELRLRNSRKTEKFGSIKLTSREFEEFSSLISKLQCLKIPYLLKTDTSKIPVPPASYPSTSLNALRLNTKEPYVLSIVEKSSQLKHLNIDVYSDQQLRKIIIAVPNLEILILRLRGCTNHGFTGENEESSFRRLKKLEYLHIIDCEGIIEKKFFNELRFPRLKYLGLNLKHGDNLPETLSNMPALRTLKVILLLRNFHWIPKGISKLCKSIGNLEHLIVDKLAPDKRLSDQRKLEIFNLLSNLRFITCCREGETFIFDRLSGRASYSETCKLKFFDDKINNTWPYRRKAPWNVEREIHLMS